MGKFLYFFLSTYCYLINHLIIYAIWLHHHILLDNVANFYNKNNKIIHIDIIQIFNNLYLLFNKIDHIVLYSLDNNW